MDTGIYVALSKEIGIFRDMEVTANNIANVNTSGFQSEDLLFSDYLVEGNRKENRVAFANDRETFTNTQQGELRVTGNPLDAAIEGKGYFVVQTPLGTRFTRSGSFKINGSGQLVSAEGYPVLDDSNTPIEFDNLDKDVSIRDDGTVQVDGAPRARMNVVMFDNPQLLQRVGNTLFSSKVAPKPAEDFRVAGGMLEKSNVQSFKEISHMMKVSHSITNIANYISTIYSLERKASDTLAKVYT